MGSILISGAVFLIGIYLTERRKGVEKKYLIQIAYVLYVLFATLISLFVLDIVVVLSATDLEQLAVFSLVFTAALSLIPTLARFSVLLNKPP
jgi:hypothetical protein